MTHVDAFDPKAHETQELKIELARREQQISVANFKQIARQQGASEQQLTLIALQFRNFEVVENGVIHLRSVEHYLETNTEGSNFPITAKILRKTLDAIESKGQR